MYAGDFERLCRTLNPRLRIFVGSGDRGGWAGLYYWLTRFDPDLCASEFRSGGNWRMVCGVPVNWFPERTIKQGQVIWKRGWREAIALAYANNCFERIPKHLGGENILNYGHVTVEA